MKGRILELIGFALATMFCVLWVGANWVSLHLLSFPCDDPTGALSCEQVVDRAFAWRAGPAVLLWLLAGWSTFRVK